MMGNFVLQKFKSTDMGWIRSCWKQIIGLNSCCQVPRWLISQYGQVVQCQCFQLCTWTRLILPETSECKLCSQQHETNKHGERGSTPGQTRCHPKTTGTSPRGSTGMWNKPIWLKYVGQNLVFVSGPGVMTACLPWAKKKISCLVYSSLQTHSRLAVRAKWEEWSSAVWSWLQLDIGPAARVGSGPG